MIFEVLANKHGRNFRYTDTLCEIWLITIKTYDHKKPGNKSKNKLANDDQ